MSNLQPTERDEASQLTPILERNIRALYERRVREQAQASGEEKLANTITTAIGSMPFIYLHIVIFGFWIAANLDWLPGVPRWDNSLVGLSATASVEAIFLTTFVLISQNRMSRSTERLADLDLQISLLTEHELTKLVTLVVDIAEHIGVESKVDEEVEEITRDVAPEAVLDHLEATDPNDGDG
jgi:uncharacterized membrane protein